LILDETPSRTHHNIDLMTNLPHKFLKSIKIPFLIGIVVAGCSSASNVTRNENQPQYTTPSSVIEYTPEELQAARNLYVQGIAAFEMEDYNQALDLLTMAYIKLPEHAGVNYAMADAYMMTGDFTNAAYYGKRAVNLESDNKYYHLKLAEIHFRAGQAQQVIEALKVAAKAVPNDPEILFFLASTYSDEGNYKESNAIYGQLIERQGPDVQIEYQRYRNYLAMEDEQGAIESLERIFELDPANPAILQSLGTQYLERGETEKALEIYEKALETNPTQPEIKMALADLYIRQNQWDEVGDLLMDVMRDPTVQRRSKADLVQFLMANFVRDPDNEPLRKQTAKVIDYYSQQNPDDAAAQALAADFYLSTADYDSALIRLRETIRLMPENEPAWRQLIQLLYTQSEFDAIIDMKDEAEAAVPEDAFVRFFIGSAYSLNGDNENAVTWLKLSTQAPARGEFKSAVWGTLGDALYSSNRFNEAWQAYEESLKLDPDNATALNNYAYYLSVQGTQLEKAIEMSKKSLEFEPENASFLDTLGWIYFQKGQYNEALTYIRKAVEVGGVSATVYEHLGDVYYKLGNDDAAQEWWGKAFDSDPSRIHLLDKLKIN
jgi:tetratricopeptide (TPR) repeat protein